MKRNANEKYSGRQGDAADDVRAAEGMARGGRAAQLKNADLAAGRRLSLSCRFVHAQVFSQPLISQRRGIVFLCVSFVDTQRATSSREA